MARKGYLEEVSIKKVLQLAERTLIAGLNDKTVSKVKRMEVAAHLYGRRIPNKTEEVGKVASSTTINVIKSGPVQVEQKEVATPRPEVKVATNIGTAS